MVQDVAGANTLGSNRRIQNKRRWIGEDFCVRVNHNVE